MKSFRQFVSEGVDIKKEYKDLSKKSIQDLRKMLKSQSKVSDTSEYRTKDHAISTYLRNKHGNKVVAKAFNLDEEDIHEAEYEGRKVKLNKPFRTPDGPKKFAVYVKKGDKVIIVRFGDPNMEIKADDPVRRKSFRARHKCDTANDPTTPRYWSCKMW